MPTDSSGFGLTPIVIQLRHAEEAAHVATVFRGQGASTAIYLATSPRDLTSSGGELCLSTIRKVKEGAALQPAGGR